MENRFLAAACQLEVNMGVNYHQINVPAPRSPAEAFKEEDTGMALNIITIQTKPDGFEYQHYGPRSEFFSEVKELGWKSKQLQSKATQPTQSECHPSWSCTSQGKMK